MNKNIEHVIAAIRTKGFSIDVLELDASTRTAIEAAQAIGCDVAQIVKSLIFKTVCTHQPVLVLASGVNRVNENHLAKIVGEKLKKADADETRHITGFVIGGVAPVGHKNKIEHILIDEDLLQHESVWAAAGTPNSVFSMKSADITNITSGKVVSIK